MGSTASSSGALSRSKLKKELRLRNLPTDGNKYEMWKRLDEDDIINRLNTERSNFYERVIEDLNVIPEIEVSYRRQVWIGIYQFYCLQYLSSEGEFNFMKSMPDFMLKFAGLMEQYCKVIDTHSLTVELLHNIITQVSGEQAPLITSGRPKAADTESLFNLYGNLAFDDEIIGHTMAIKVRKDFFTESPYRLNMKCFKMSNEVYMITANKLSEILYQTVLDSRYVSIDRLNYLIETNNKA